MFDSVLLSTGGKASIVFLLQLLVAVSFSFVGFCSFGFQKINSLAHIEIYNRFLCEQKSQF